MNESKQDPRELSYVTWQQDPTPENMAGLVSTFSKDIDQAISRAGGSVSPLHRGMAKQVLFHAAKTYDPKSKAKFSSWVNTQMQRLNRSLRESKFTVQVSEHQAQQAFKLRDALTELEAETGFPPSDAQMADRLGMSLKTVKKFRKYITPEAINQTDTDTGEDDSADRIAQDMVYASLPPRDQVIMQHSFGYNGAPLLPGTLLAKKLKITPAAISQRVKRIQSLLQETADAASKT